MGALAFQSRQMPYLLWYSPSPIPCLLSLPHRRGEPAMTQTQSPVTYFIPPAQMSIVLPAQARRMEIQVGSLTQSVHILTLLGDLAIWKTSFCESVQGSVVIAVSSPSGSPWRRSIMTVVRNFYNNSLEASIIYSSVEQILCSGPCPQY